MNELDFIQSVKIQGEGYLLNGTMSVPKADGNREYELIKLWLKDNELEPEFTKEELDKAKREQEIYEAKAIKQEDLANIKVTTSNGNVFDGNEVARSSMVSAIMAADIISITKTTWKLADNSVAEITLDELKEALALSIQEVGRIVIGE